MILYFVCHQSEDAVAEALAEEFRHPPVLAGVSHEAGEIDRTAPHWFTIGHYVTLSPHDGRLPDGSREYRCQTEFPGTVRAIFAGLDGREITAEEIQS